ncbi:MAG: hypothetical protein F6K26_35665 [Moorea sp. SIO2I5]|nr:hypothetical protein [Moorena sp. SIO2I5]
MKKLKYHSYFKQNVLKLIYNNKKKLNPLLLLPTPYSLLPTPYSLLPTPYSLKTSTKVPQPIEHCYI